MADSNRLNNLIRTAGSVLGVELDVLVAVTERRILTPTHSTDCCLKRGVCSATLSNRLLAVRSSKERHRKSFIPAAIKLFNSSNYRK